MGGLPAKPFAGAVVEVVHRLSAVRKASRIVVLKHGRIIETGTHEELSAIAKGEYARLVKLQGMVEQRGQLGRRLEPALFFDAQATT